MSFRTRVTMVVAVAVLCVIGAGASERAAADAVPDCLPPAYVRGAIRGAGRIDLVRLGQIGDHEVDALDPDPGRFVGYRRIAARPLLQDDAEDASRMLSGRNLGCVPVGKARTGIPPYAVGFAIAGGGGSVRVALVLPVGAVEIELPNGMHVTSALSPSGLRAWQRLVTSLAEQARRAPDDFERDLAQP